MDEEKLKDKLFDNIFKKHTTLKDLKEALCYHYKIERKNYILQKFTKIFKNKQSIRNRAILLIYELKKDYTLWEIEQSIVDVEVDMTCCSSLNYLKRIKI